MFAIGLSCLVLISMVDTNSAEMRAVDVELKKRYDAWNEVLRHSVCSGQMVSSRISSEELYDNEHFRSIVALGSHVVPGVLQLASRDHSILEAASQITKWKYHVVRTGDIPGRFAWHIEEFPELKSSDGPPNRIDVWNYWWRKGRFLTGERFTALHMEWRNLKASGKMDMSEKVFRRIVDLGIPVLPCIVAVVSESPELISAVSELSGGSLRADATADECRAWWEKNRDRFTLPGQPPADASAATVAPNDCGAAAVEKKGTGNTARTSKELGRLRGK